MVKHVSIMISFCLSAIFLFLASDMISAQVAFNDIENVSLTVSYYISKSGGITEDIKNFVKREANAEINCAMDECRAIKVGDTYFYNISKSFNPLIIRGDKNVISIKRSVVIGLYN